MAKFEGKPTVSNRLPRILESTSEVVIDQREWSRVEGLITGHRRLVTSRLINDIQIRKRLRATDQDNVAKLAASMAIIGLRTPITVVIDGEDVILASGLHRLEAAKKLGWETISAFDEPIGTDDSDIRLWEISENLHRAELTVTERAEHISEWVRLTGEKAKAQLAPSIHTGGRSDQGINAAVRELGVDRTEAQRAMKIASIAPDAKEAARTAGLDDNQSALLAVARAPAEQQMQKVEEITRERSARQQRRAQGVRQRSADAVTASPPLDRSAEAEMPVQLAAPPSPGLVNATGASEPTPNSGPSLTGQQLVDRQAMLTTSMDLFCINERGELRPSEWKVVNARDEPFYGPVARFLGFHLGEWMHANDELIAVAGLAETIAEKRRQFDALWCFADDEDIDWSPVFKLSTPPSGRRVRKVVVHGADVATQASKRRLTGRTLCDQD
jgi:ParB-like chromosome segregation protein Spo0J